MGEELVHGRSAVAKRAQRWIVGSMILCSYRYFYVEFFNLMSQSSVYILLFNY